VIWRAQSSTITIKVKNIKPKNQALFIIIYLLQGPELFDILEVPRTGST
jgi:hypothetical protein